jgi:hypothetical protein
MEEIAGKQITVNVICCFFTEQSFVTLHVEAGVKTIFLKKQKMPKKGQK